MLRCGNCGAEASDWAGRCPSRRASLDGAVVVEGPAPTPETPAGQGWSGLSTQEGESFDHATEPGRWGDPKKLVAAGLVLVVALGALVTALALLGRNANRHAAHPAAAAVSPAPSATYAAGLGSYTLVYADDPLRVVPLDGRPKHTVRLLPAGAPGPAMAVGDSLAVPVSGTVYSIASPFSDAVTVVGSGDALFPSVYPGVFGVFQRGNLDTGGSGRVVLERVGGELAPALTLPPGYRPEAHLGAEFLLSGPENGAQRMLRLWQPGPSPAGTFVGTLGRLHAVVGISDTTVAWIATDPCSDVECPLHMTDTSTGADRVVLPPPGHHGFEPGGAFSPGGQRIAAFVAGAFDNHPVAQLAMVDVGAATSRVVAGSDVEVGEPRGFATWTPDGVYALFCGGSGNLRAWALRDGTVVGTGAPGSSNIVAF